MIERFIVLILSFFLGTIPFAYLIVKKASGTDIRNEGTGNVGAMNSYDITHKKHIGVFVFIADCMKGVAAVFAARLLTHDDITILSASSILVVLGHNFNPFLKFKGGRGLSTATGVFFMLNPFVVLIWGILWYAGIKIIKNDVHVGNIVATIFTSLLIYYTPEKIVRIFNFIHITKGQLIIISASICVLILLKHTKLLIELIRNEFRKS